MTLWMDILAVTTLAILAFILFALAHRVWRIVRRNESFEAGGSLGDQMIGPRDDAKL